ncbi:MAG TPA: DUF4230 domain-containing protein [Cytophagaceae bacterium]|jgi:hypothetical protein|nr:DUF4230 domain-containing protein [Cytophagaceae bacterium]
MSKIRTALVLLSLLTIPLCLYLLYHQFSNPFKIEEDKSVITNNMIVEKIESIGKLELCKYYIKDVLEHKEIKDWWPDSRVVLIVSGEVTGCIDLKKIDSTAIEIEETKIRIRLPEPEICYIKINHQESKVYDIENEFFEKGKLIDKAYALAEKNIRDGALKMKILEQTKANAQTTLKPLLEGFSGKTVELYY